MCLYLEEVNRYPLIPPKVERATEMGITQENIPKSFSPKVCNAEHTGKSWYMHTYAKHIKWCFTGDKDKAWMRSEVTHHSHSIRIQQLLRGHGGEVCNVGESIDKRHQGNGNVNCSWKVPTRTHQKPYQSISYIMFENSEDFCIVYIL